MMYNNQSKENNDKRNKVELWFLYTAFWINARNVHTKFLVNDGDNITPRTIKALLK